MSFLKNESVSSRLKFADFLVQHVMFPKTLVSCRDLHEFANYTEICSFTKKEPSCHDGNYVNFLAFVYCNFSEKLVLTSLIPLSICLLILFMCIGICADDFFCPVLGYLSNLMKLSENVAGVTLLALGNGAPDIISAILAVLSSKQSSSKRDVSPELGESTGLAFGALLGAAMFICTNVVGMVSLVKPFKSIERPLLRDISFLLFAAFMASTIVYKQQVTLWQSSALLFAYAAYVTFVASIKCLKAVSARIRERREPNDSRPNETDYLLINESSSSDEEDDRIGVAETADCPSDQSSILSISNDAEQPTIAENPHSLESDIHRIFSPFAQRSTNSKAQIAIGVVKYIPMLMFRLSCPQITADDNGFHNWNKLLNSLHCFLTPLFAMSLTGTLSFKIGRAQVPISVIILPVGFSLGMLNFALTYHNRPPKYVAIFALISFPMSMIWIYVLAGNVVNLLNAIGVILNVSQVLMGMTFLAVGNSMADSVSDVVMARNGMPNMAISACYAGPMLNILLGMGIPLTYLASQTYPIPLYLKSSLLQTMIAYSLVGLMALTLVMVPLCRFQFTKLLGICLILLYLLYLIAGIVIEFTT